METYLANVKVKTGKTVADFKKLAAEKGLTKYGDIMAWLKAEFGLGHGHANAVTHMVMHGDEPRESDDEGIAKHFTGAKATWTSPMTICWQSSRSSALMFDQRLPKLTSVSCAATRNLASYKSPPNASTSASN